VVYEEWGGVRRRYKPRAQATGAIGFALGRMLKLGRALQLGELLDAPKSVENRGHISTGRLRSRLVLSNDYANRATMAEEWSGSLG